MKKIGIVTKREYLRRVNKKSFIFITLFAPVLFAALVFVPLWLSSIKSSDVYDVMVADRTGKYASLFKDTDRFRFAGTGNPSPVDELKESSSGMFAILEITDDLLKNPKAVTLYSDKQIPQDLKREVNHILSPYLEKEKRASFNIPNLDEIIENSRVHIDIQTIKWGKDGTATESSSEISSVIGMIFTFIIYMFIMMYGAMVMQGVMEEKTNRIVEVMISSVRPFDLMMGKIIGIGWVGLTQVFIWCILTVILLAAGGLFLGSAGGYDLSAVQSGMSYNAAEMSSAVSMTSKLSSFNFIEIIIYFVLFFIGGYVSYASLFAAIGSAIDTPEDSQQFMTPMMIFLMFSVYAGLYSVNNPDGPLAFWCSLIPFTSPVVMMVRIPYEIPFWQILLSLVLLYTSAIFLVWMSAKIYRVGILMYGKKPSFKEIARWLKY
ncbi:MAG: ABC transporter permease [Tannerella sp.]|nr:ABC transporter permease [Tannerella sp.]